MSRKALEIIPGQCFGNLVVLSKAKKGTQGHIQWFCACYCGSETVVTSSNLQGGNTKSCGCGRTTHGETRDGEIPRTYTVWSNMRDRCRPASLDNKHYYGRGISICERWDVYEKFKEDMGECPEGKTLDRIDNDGNYEPGNCRWATMKEQGRNRRNNVILTYDGHTACLAEWAEITGINYHTLDNRLKRSKWTTEEILTTPVRKYRS